MEQSSGNTGIYRAWSLLAAALLAVLVLGVFGCAPSREGREILSDGLLEAYADSCAELLPDCVSRRAETDDLLAAVAAGDAAACFDIQARSALENGLASHWYPGAEAAVVIAIDRAQTSARPGSWRELSGTDEKLGFLRDLRLDRTPYTAMLLGAIAYGLEGEDYSIQSALSLLRGLHERGALAGEGEDSPILICLDYEAAALAAQGRELEIAVPEDGTLSFAAGILSDGPLELDSRAVARSAGMRTAQDAPGENGPEAAAYVSAVPVPDHARFLRETENAARLLQREVLDIRHLSSADHREHVLAAILFLLAAVFWAAAVLRRTMRRNIRALTLALAFLVIGWTLLRLFKWQLPTLSLANRICWYSFYLFQLPIPCVLLWLGLVIDKPEDSSRRPPAPVARLLLVYAAAMVLIYTNDLHQLVWRFDPAGDWNNEYSYGVVFYLIALYNYGVLFAAILTMFRKSLRAPGSLERLFPLLASVLMAGYTAAYVADVPFARTSDVTIITCGIAVLFFEAAIRTGMVPMNTHYGKLFSHAPFHMQLLDHSGKAVLRASATAPPDAQLWERLRRSGGKAVERDQDTLLYANPIRGGLAVWEEDISSLNLLRRDTERSIKNLSAANRLLQKEEEVRRRALQSRIGDELFSAMEREIRKKTEKLSQLVQGLPQAEDHRDRSARIILLLCHIKRRCNLFFIAHEDNAIMGQELAVYLEELGELAGYQGVKAVLRCSSCGAVEIRRAILCYDLVFEVLDQAVEHGVTAVLGTLMQQTDGLELKLLTGQFPEKWELPEELRAAAAAEGGTLSCRELDENVGISLHFPGEEGGR